MLPLSKRRRDGRQNLAQANAAKLRHVRNGLPDPEYIADTESPTPMMTVAVEGAEADGGGELSAIQEEGEYRLDWVLDGSEGMSDGEGSIASCASSQLEGLDGIEGDCWSKAETDSEHISEIGELQNTSGLSLGLDGETSCRTAESRLPGNSRQMRWQTPRTFTLDLGPIAARSILTD
jgi:hypothetical protein